MCMYLNIINDGFKVLKFYVDFDPVLNHVA